MNNSIPTLIAGLRPTILALALGAMSLPARAGEFSVYHVGNSLTGDLWSKFPKIMTRREQEQGNTYIWQAHFRGATSLTFMHDNPTDPKTMAVGGINGKTTLYKRQTEKGFIPWTVALPGQHWDVVTLQVWQDDDKATLKRDTEAVNDMIKITRTRPDNATTRFFIYAPWTVSKYDVLDSYSKAFQTPTSDSPDQLGVATRDYFRHVTDSVRKSNPDVAMIPSGEVLLALDEKMRAGKFEGLTSVRQLHRDGIHLNSIGQNVTAWTAYAVIFKKSPVGLPNNSHAEKDYPPFKNVAEVSPADLKLIQETIWEVVTSPELCPYTKVLMSESANAADDTVSTASLLREATDLSRLPLHRNWTARLDSSCDRAGGNKDYNQYISKEGNTALLADRQGPGAIVRIWFTGLKKVGGNASQVPAGTLKIYIDDAPTPVLNSPIVDLFKGTALFMPPFTRVSGSAYFTYLPIPYAKHCRITVDLDEPEDLFYQINSLHFPEGTKVRPFSLQLTAEDQAALGRATAAWMLPIASPADAPAPITTKLTIPAGASAAISDLKGPGTVQSLMLAAPTVSDSRLRKLVLRAWFDGHKTPDIEVPVADFFGNAYGHKVFESLILSQNATGEMTFRLPMPYNTSARFAIENGNGAPVALGASLVMKSGPVPPGSLYLHADFNQEITAKGKAHRWAHVETGPGHFVGVVQAMQGGGGWGYCEGDDQIRVDDEKFIPSVKFPSTVIAPWNGTGTEDFFNSAFYFSEGTNPRELNGCLVKQFLGRIDAFRFLLNDAPIFQKSLDAQIENSEVNDQAGVYYSSVAFWYGVGERTPLAPMPAAATLGFPTVTFTGIDPRFSPVYIEGESLIANAKATGGAVQAQEMKEQQHVWSNESQLYWRGGNKGDTLTLPFKVATAGEYTICIMTQRGPSCGFYTFAANGNALPKNVDGYGPELQNVGPIELGAATLPAGTSTLVVTLGGNNRRSSGNDFGLDLLALRTVVKPKAP